MPRNGEKEFSGEQVEKVKYFHQGMMEMFGYLVCNETKTLDNKLIIKAKKF